jgi:hypothetical protein
VLPFAAKFVLNSNTVAACNCESDNTVILVILVCKSVLAVEVSNAVTNNCAAAFVVGDLAFSAATTDAVASFISFVAGATTTAVPSTANLTVLDAPLAATTVTVKLSVAVPTPVTDNFPPSMHIVQSD